MQDWRDRLRECLDVSGRTRFAVCGEAGLNSAYLTQVLETKAVTPRIDNLAKIAAVLGTSTSFLVDGIKMSPDAMECLALFTSMDEERRYAVMVLMRDLAAESS